MTSKKTTVMEYRGGRKKAATPAKVTREWTREDGVTFPVLISDEAFAEWLRERPHLKLRNYPDRPPDIDSETTRQWTPHPGIERVAMESQFAERNKGKGDGVPWKMKVASWNDGMLVLKLIINRSAPRRFLARIIILTKRDGETAEKHIEGDWRMRDSVEQAFDDTVEAMRRAVGDPDGNEVMVTTEAQFRATLSTAASVYAALDDWYAKRNPIQ